MPRAIVSTSKYRPVSLNAMHKFKAPKSRREEGGLISLGSSLF